MKSAIGIIVLFFATGAFAATSAPTTAGAKLWANDLAAFMNQNPRGQWIVAKSQQPAISASEADNFARQNAAEQLVPLIRQRLHDPHLTTASRRELERVLAGGDWIVDRQLESKDRPYGTIWSETILIDASPRKLDELSRRVQSVVEREHKRRVVAGMGGALLVIIATLSYVVLNWLTRGYLKFRLAMMSLGFVLIGMMVLGAIMHI